MNKNYDVAIIGCGTAGIFAGYELISKHPELKICVLEQGGDIYSRHCPIVAGKVRETIRLPRPIQGIIILILSTFTNTGVTLCPLHVLLS